MPEFVTLRDPRTGLTQEVKAAAARFFPGLEVVVEDNKDAPPKKNAAAEEWRAYVVDHGFATEEAAADLNRDQLIALVPATITEEN